MTLDLTTLEASLRRDEEVAAKATPGPWEADSEGHILTPGDVLVTIRGIVAMLPSEMSNDAAFIAHARTALLDRVKDCRTLGEEVRRLSDENERLRVQLAGCAVAALDGSEEQEAAPHSYGWSPAYADVIKLRRAHTAAESSLAEAVRALERALADEHDSDCGLHDAPAGAARRCDCSIRAALSSPQPRKDTP